MSEEKVGSVFPVLSMDFPEGSTSTRAFSAVAASLRRCRLSVRRKTMKEGQDLHDLRITSAIW